jgi:hypothetical protein
MAYVRVGLAHWISHINGNPRSPRVVARFVKCSDVDAIPARRGGRATSHSLRIRAGVRDLRSHLLSQILFHGVAWSRTPILAARFICRTKSWLEALRRTCRALSRQEVRIWHHAILQFDKAYTAADAAPRHPRHRYNRS